MFIISSLALSFLLILCVCPLSDQQSDHDIICKVKGGILCIKDELNIIAKVAEGIARKSMDIEKYIYSPTNSKRLHKYIGADTNYTRSYIPTLPYHKHFFLRNNIDKKYLTELILEGHDAMIFFYNSINDLLKVEDVYSEKTDHWFKIILNNIREDIICRYRSVLDIFSQQWKPSNPTDRMYFIEHHLAPSDIHKVRSLIIARSLKERIEQIDKVIENLDKKYF